MTRTWCLPASCSTRAYGIYRFDGLANYLARRPAQYQQFAGSGAIDTHKHQIAFYLQDEWRALPGLTISPGFRYEMALLPDYQQATVPANRYPLATDIPDDKEMIGPRLGLAWDVRQDGRTVIRAAAGLFYAPPYITLWEQAIASNGGNPDLSSSVTYNTTARSAAFTRRASTSRTPLNSLPITLAQSISCRTALRLVQSTNVFFFDKDFKLPRSVQFRGALEQQLANGVTASVDYTQIAVSRMDRVRDINLPTPTIDASGRPVYTPSASVSVNSLRPNPRYGAIYVTESSARSLYRSMTATWASAARITADVTYTLGCGFDDHGTAAAARTTWINNLENNTTGQHG